MNLIDVHKLVGFDQTFWDTYYNNINVNLRHFAIIGTYEFNIPLTVLNLLSRTCKYLFNMIEWRIIRSKQLREKWSIPFGRALCAKSIAHPFNYTGDIVRVIPIFELMTAPLGLRVLNVSGGLFNESYLETTRIAFTTISLITKSKFSFVAMLFLATVMIAHVEISADDFIDLGEFPDEPREDIYSVYRPGRYLVFLNLPTYQNPITLGAPFIDMNNIYLCIARKWEYRYADGNNQINATIDIKFIANNITHIIAAFKTVEQTAYEWDNYKLILEEHQQVRTSSFIQPKN